MYTINTENNKPDIGYMFRRVNEMCQRGIKINDVDESIAKLSSIREDLAKIIKAETGIDNVNSPKQIVAYLSSIADIDVVDCCFNGEKWTSNATALTALADLGYQFAGYIMKYRTVGKYLDSLESMSKYARAGHGLVHPEVHTSKTNRVQYRNPALMTVPKDLLWHLFTPRKPGNQLYSADIKNQEPFIMINMLGINQLKPALSDAEGFYNYIFKRVYAPKAKFYIYYTDKVQEPTPLDVELLDKMGLSESYYSAYKPVVSSTYCNGIKVEAIQSYIIACPFWKSPIYPKRVLIKLADGTTQYVETNFEPVGSIPAEPKVVEILGNMEGLEVRCAGIQRSEFKTIWNAMTYGQGVFGVEKTAKNIDGKLAYKYFKAIPELKKYHKQCGDMAKDGIGETRTAFGTPVYSEEYEEGKLKRALLDLPVQGTGADILALLIERFDNYTKSNGLEGKIEIYFPRHDELILEVDKDFYESVGDDEVKRIILDILEHQVNDWEPFKLDVERVVQESEFMLPFED